MKKISILIAGCLAVSFLQAQDKSHRFGIKVEGGASIITTNYNDIYNLNPSIDASFIKYQDQWAPSYNFGFIYSNQFSKRFEISAEVKFSQIQSTILYYPESFGQDKEEYKIGIRISYISIPIYYGFKISKFTPSIGFRFSLLISDRLINYETRHGDTHQKIDTDEINYGPQLGLTYDISEKFAVEAFYYHGINNLVNWEMYQFQSTEEIWKSRQLTLGVKYTFYKLEN